jgi:hypothetical protein
VARLSKKALIIQSVTVCAGSVRIGNLPNLAFPVLFAKEDNMNWLVLSYFLTIGTVNQQYYIQDAYIHEWKAPDSAIFTTLGTELVAMDHFFLSAEVQTEEKYVNFITFAPFFSQYTVKAGFRWGGFEAGYVDNCLHPSLALDWSTPSRLYGGYSGFYITFKGSTKLF